MHAGSERLDGSRDCFPLASRCCFCQRWCRYKSGHGFQYCCCRFLFRYRRQRQRWKNTNGRESRLKSTRHGHICSSGLNERDGKSGQFVKLLPRPGSHHQRPDGSSVVRTARASEETLISTGESGVDRKDDGRYAGRNTVYGANAPPFSLAV